MKKRALVFALAGMMVVSSLTGCGSSFDGDAVAITVGEDEVTADVANFYARYTQAQYETYYGSYLGDDMWNTEASEGQTYEEFVKASVQEALEDAMKKFVGPNPRILALPKAFKCSSVHLMLKDEVYEG